MSTTKPTGGPAFPMLDYSRYDERDGTIDHFATQGMSLRDFFAIKIAAAQCTATSRDQDFMQPHYVREQFNPDHSEHGKTVAQVVAERAYAIADAALGSRSSRERSADSWRTPARLHRHARHRLDGQAARLDGGGRRHADRHRRDCCAVSGDGLADGQDRLTLALPWRKTHNRPARQRPAWQSARGKRPCTAKALKSIWQG